MTRTIISASRRTDIPAFHSRWFVDRVREGYCQTVNPFNPRQVTRVSLAPDDVAAIVFWTRNPRPLFGHMDELDCRGFRYYFQYTITSYPRVLEPRTPPFDEAVATFQELAQCIGPHRVVWRYDPILITNVTDCTFHAENFARLAEALKTSTRRVVISLFDPYRAALARLRALGVLNVHLLENPEHTPAFARLTAQIVSIARANGLEIVSCAEEIDLQPYGIAAGKCVDDNLIRHVLGVEASKNKDKNQRRHCHCVESKDIGTYGTCFFACQYCYQRRFRNSPRG